MSSEVEELKKQVTELQAKLTSDHWATHCVSAKELDAANKLLKLIKQDLKERADNGVVAVGNFVWFSLCEHLAELDKKGKR